MSDDAPEVMQPYKRRTLGETTIAKHLERVAITIPLNSSYGPKNPEDMLSVLSQRIYAYLQEHEETTEQVIHTLARAGVAFAVLHDRMIAWNKEQKAAKRVGWHMNKGTG